jgi:hypothetical protein
MGTNRLCADVHAVLSVPCIYILFLFDRMRFALFCFAATQPAALFECTPRFPRGGELQSARENTALADCIVYITAT